MKNYTVFGNERTNLKLTEKAQAVYDVTDPLEIREFGDNNGNYSYDIIGCFERSALSADELNNYLEDVFNF